MIVKFLQTSDVTGYPRFEEGQVVDLPDSLAEELQARGTVEFSSKSVERREDALKKAKTVRKS